MPSYNGTVAGRIDEDSFRIPKASAHPDEAFIALTYLVTTGVDKLIVGSDTQPPAYGALLSAIPSKNTRWLNAHKAQFPFVTQASWDILLAGMNYPDSPSAEGFVPNMVEAWRHLQYFEGLLSTTPNLNLVNAESDLVNDLTSIFNTQYQVISGKAGTWGVALSYHDGSDKTANSYHGDGIYAFTVSNGWSGTVTPSRDGFAFNPTFRNYTYVITDQPDQNYTAVPWLYLPMIMR